MEKTSGINFYRITITKLKEFRSSKHPLQRQLTKWRNIKPCELATPPRNSTKLRLSPNKMDG